MRLRVVAGVAVLLGTVAAGLAQVRVETGVREFVPRGDASVRATTEVAERFGGDPIVVLLETAKPMALLGKDRLPELLRLEGELATLPHVTAVYGPGTVLNQIAGQAQDMLAELAGYRDGLRGRAEDAARRAGESKAAIARAGRRATAGFDARYATLLARGMPGGLPTLHNQTFVNRVILNDEGDPRPQWDFLVPRTDTVAITVRPDASLRQSQVEALVASVRRTVARHHLGAQRVTVSGVPAMVASLGEQIRHEIPVLGGAAVLGVGAWFLLTSWTRRRFRLLPLAATLLGTGCTLGLAGWTGRPLALTAVAFLPVLLGIGSDFMTYLHRGAGTRTVVAAALASAAGFAALAVTPVPAVADLGLSLAVGLLVTIAVSLVLHRWLPVPADLAPVAAAEAAPWSLGRRGAQVALVAVAAGAGWALLPSLPLTSDFRSMASGLRAYGDAEHVERVVGASGEVVVALRGKDVLTPATLRWMERVRSDAIAAHGDVLKPVLSPVDVLGFLGTSPTGSQLEAGMRLLPRYLETSVVTPRRDMAIMTYGVGLDDVEQLRGLRDYLRREVAHPPAGISVDVAGLPVVAVSARQAIQHERLLTSLLGVLAAGAVLLLLLPRRRVALLAVASALATSGVAMLVLRLTGVALTPMTAGLGSLTAAVACEFTVVLAAARAAGDRRMARAVDLAAAASATGYSVLALSQLSLIRGFGAVLALTVLLALAVSRLLVRAFLAPSAPAAAVVPVVDRRELVEVGR